VAGRGKQSADGAADAFALPVTVMDGVEEVDPAVHARDVWIFT
jgi:hypothetical protein